MIKLTKNAVGNDLMLSAPIDDQDTSGAGRWVTNGRWALQRYLIENGEQMTSTAAMAAITKIKLSDRSKSTPGVHAVVKSAVNNPALKKYVRLPFYRESQGNGKKRGLAAIYEHLESGEQIFLNLDFVDMMAKLGMFVFHCYAESNACPAYPDTFDKVEGVTAVIMPLRAQTMEQDRQDAKAEEADRKARQDAETLRNATK